MWKKAQSGHLSTCVHINHHNLTEAYFAYFTNGIIKFWLYVHKCISFNRHRFSCLRFLLFSHFVYFVTVHARNHRLSILSLWILISKTYKTMRWIQIWYSEISYFVVLRWIWAISPKVFISRNEIETLFQSLTWVNSPSGWFRVSA